GDIITGLEKFSHSEEIVVFHAGTSRAHGKIVTSGGRVLGITALGEDIEKAIENAYNAVKEVNFSGAYHRTDIGKKALNRSR
ncbi:MAG: phosphoribosylamine--glycine ligase, partial [Deltaproteobacteria bacterium]|nr:phosphoribosylamine--glycine ligase [Deltaproteobacteria bacterium]